MIHDIHPHKLANHYYNREIKAGDKIVTFCERNVLLHKNDGKLALPEYDGDNALREDLRYLFSIDDTGYYLLPNRAAGDLEPIYVRELIRQPDRELSFAVMTAWHLYTWYEDNKFCGRCGGALTHDSKERMLKCSCGNMIFPKIAPAVIIGVTHQDKLLVSKYAFRGYKGFALLAGFMEIGETPEETVMREAMEEVGLCVKNIRYYKSQPGGIDSNVLMGFFCELDGSADIRIDESELAMAAWFRRGDITLKNDGYSLTSEMIEYFVKNPQEFK